MDGVALASVITSGVLGITTGGIAVWSARQNAKLARETRTQQRLADSYLEVLRLVEREAQWVDDGINEWVIHAEYNAEPPERYPPDPQRASEPPVTDQATIAAHLAAFGSPKVCGLYEAWRITIAEINTNKENLMLELEKTTRGDPVEQISFGDLKTLREVLQPRQCAARQALADAIAEELCHR